MVSSTEGVESSWSRGIGAVLAALLLTLEDY